MQKQPHGTGITGTAGLLSCCAALRPAAGGDVGVGQLGACAVHTSAGGLGKLRKALAGGFQADGGIGGVHPGFRLGEIYRFFHLRTLRSLARCIWLISYRVYFFPLYSMFRAFSSSSWSRSMRAGRPAPETRRKRCDSSSSRTALRPKIRMHDPAGNLYR